MYIYISILPSILAVSLSRCAGSGCRRVPHRVPRRVRLEWATRWCAVAQGRAAAAAPQANDTGALGQARLLCPALLSRPPPHPPLSPLPSPPSLYPRLPSPLPCLPPLATAPSPSSFLPSFWDPPLLFQPHPSPTPALGVLPPSLGGSTPGFCLFVFVCLFVRIAGASNRRHVDDEGGAGMYVRTGTEGGVLGGVLRRYSEGYSEGYSTGTYGLACVTGARRVLGGYSRLSGTHGYPVDCAARGSAPNRKRQSARKCEVFRNHPSHRMTDTHARTHTCTCTCTCACTHTHASASARTHTHMHRHTHARVRR